jgi:hypothetical protein
MKNYDIKNAVEELGNKTVVKKGNRLAFLVRNMFDRVKSGFLKHVPVAEQPVIEQPTVQETPVVATPVTPVQQVEVPVQPVQAEKNYTLKTKASDMTIFNNKTTISGRRPLLISVAFKSKLVANRAVKFVKDVVETVDNKVEEAINKYHELIDERTALIEKIRDIEKQITVLVKENNLTQEQVSKVKSM